MKILLVEDEKEVAGFLKRGFKYEGHQVRHLDDGGKVVQHLNQNHYDVIVLDLLIPGSSGEEILTAIRHKRNETPVIVLTSIDEVATKTKLLDLGADDYLVKPFSFMELIARIKSITRRSRGVAQLKQELKVGELTINSNLRTVSRKGKKIRLRLKEYALLEHLMQNPDKIINRNALIESVWDYNSRLFSNTVDSHISTLRKKINEGFEEDLIETVHGVGYVLKSKNGQS